MPAELNFISRSTTFDELVVVMKLAEDWFAASTDPAPVPYTTVLLGMLNVAPIRYVPAGTNRLFPAAAVRALWNPVATLVTVV